MREQTPSNEISNAVLDMIKGVSRPVFPIDQRLQYEQRGNRNTSLSDFDSAF